MRFDEYDDVLTGVRVRVKLPGSLSQKRGTVTVEDSIMQPTGYGEAGYPSGRRCEVVLEGYGHAVIFARHLAVISDAAS